MEEKGRARTPRGNGRCKVPATETARKTVLTKLWLARLTARVTWPTERLILNTPETSGGCETRRAAPPPPPHTHTPNPIPRVQPPSTQHLFSDTGMTLSIERTEQNTEWYNQITVKNPSTPSKWLNIMNYHTHTYTHTGMHTSIHPFMHTYIHTYIHTYTFTTSAWSAELRERNALKLCQKQ